MIGKVRKLKMPASPIVPAAKLEVKAAPKVKGQAQTKPTQVVEPEGPLTPIEMPSSGKDYTDVLIWVFDAGERIYHLDHRRNLKAAKIDGMTYEMNGHKYNIILDRAFRIRWAPWKKLILEKPYGKNIYRFFNEVFRSKKIGIIYYQEPCTNKCSECDDEGGEKCKKIPLLIEPMHISRIHQPSGKVMG